MMVEVTTSTIQGRHLLRPSPELNRIVLGIVGRALERYPLLLHAIVVLSTHIQLLLTVLDAEMLSAFMNYVNSKIAIEVGRMTKWRARFWSGRYHAIPVLTDDAQVARLRYNLGHGCKEGLVRRPEEWPGVHSVGALVAGEELVGTWIDRTRARRDRKSPDLEEYKTTYKVVLHPLPCWVELTEDERRRLCAELVEEVVREAAQDGKLKGRRPVGAKAILRQHPWYKPATVKRSPAPPCHASTDLARQVYLDQRAEFRHTYRFASVQYRQGNECEFPPHCFLPGRFHDGPPEPQPPLLIREVTAAAVC